MKNTKLYHFKVVNAALVWYNMVVVLGLLRRKEQRRLSERNRNRKRRDKKGRILRNGESQRSDGRYAFVYTDCFGKQIFLYSWKLESTDPLPIGRSPCQSLREKEKVFSKMRKLSCFTKIFTKFGWQDIRIYATICDENEENNLSQQIVESGVKSRKISIFKEFLRHDKNIICLPR